MRHLTLYILISLYFSSCTHIKSVLDGFEAPEEEVAPITEEIKRFPKELQKDLAYFERYMKWNGVPVNWNMISSIEFGGLENPDKNQGECKMFGGRIKLSHSIKKDALLMKIVLFHELGHCMYFFDDDHKNKKSIMYYKVVPRMYEGDGLNDLVELYRKEYSKRRMK
jgi:hypothetical protein